MTPQYTGPRIERDTWERPHIEMALKADLYRDRIEALRYFDALDCQRCGFRSCREWLQTLQRKGATTAHCPSLGPNEAYALEVFAALDRILPLVEITQHPIQGALGLHEINQPGPTSPVLVTGNSAATQEVMMAILATTAAPFHLLFVDCQAYTVDMAMILGTFTPSRLESALKDARLAERLSHRELLLPGLTAPLKGEMEARTGWGIRIGPVCAGELPLFFKELWIPPREGLNNPGRAPSWS